MILLDEPLSALDAKVREELRVEIRMLQQRLNITTIMVTHDQEEALTMADDIVVMKDGKVMQSGTPMDLYRKPANRFVAEFIGLMNIVPSTVGIPTAENGGSTHMRPRIVGIRPEDVRLLAEHDARNHPQAVIDQIVRLGNLTRVTLRLPDNGAPHSPGLQGEKSNNIMSASGGNGHGDNDFVRLVAEIPGLGEELEVGMARSIAVAPESVRVLEWQ
ncbi:ABC transporter ATP-binding protein [Desulfonatronum parangueonense]